MLAVPFYHMSGERSGEIEFDPALLGGRVRPQLIKQAVVAYQDHRRQDSARTKGRANVVGSTRKLFRQKGTGNARMGFARTVIRTGGGVAFAKGKQNFSRVLPKKMRRLARNNAILVRILGDDAVVIEGLAFDAPKTKAMVEMLDGVGALEGCVVALNEPDDTVWLSGRNLPKTDVRLVRELNAYEILRRKKLVLSKPAFEFLVSDPVTLQHGAEAGSE